MLDPDPAFRPIRMHGGYPPLADLGLIGDGARAALAKDLVPLQDYPAGSDGPAVQPEG